ncbi:hypothetical protein [Verrucomicrobium sp. BvORR106]|uniref:hypothetical protein n=1 Tax=Verrucomicrobium sp. BvORR106 TaxID=1403819 RepID=UPI00056EE733|nr:hypothetical protein [Verrucomicrobium sp. BvORR106]
MTSAIHLGLYLSGFFSGVLCCVLFNAVKSGVLRHSDFLIEERLVEIEAAKKLVAEGWSVGMDRSAILYNVILIPPGVDGPFVASWLEEGLLLNNLRLSSRQARRLFPGASIRLSASGI